MEGHCLENADYEKDLGVVMSKDLKVVRQCEGRRVILEGKSRSLCLG